ncbi:Uncharacterised protein [Mycobacteroides abscessus subsp. massiliense]|nr:Uncharacterised protein [Mycobacteroides abscessus subsp. massiliense]SKD34613.1 Uncharacterised protein [Mycobacteroides abscessus subsp. massiliense]SKD48973.1 Uncharacterised protein [Mycobacteroides abscessus subsp. massiliense]SKD51688.1 Uncharacterised protein [Mycobacteroides abscessus subsp. massiliense]SKD60966.1 Uncharacterised protein [Mycobacteroides abscessus subsp. massiliense]
MLVAVPICMVFVFFGVSMFQHPDTCDGRPMSQWDRCQHYGRAHERLLIGSEARVPAVGYDRDSQITYKRIMASGGMALGSAAWVMAAIWLRGKTLDYRAKRRSL